MTGRNRLRASKLGATRIQSKSIGGADLSIQEQQIKEARVLRLQPSEAHPSGDWSASSQSPLRGNEERLRNDEDGWISDDLISPARTIQQDLQSAFLETGNEVIATAKQAVAGVGSLLGSASRKFDWIGTTIDKKAQQLLPDLIDTPSSTSMMKPDGNKQRGVAYDVVHISGSRWQTKPSLSPPAKSPRPRFEPQNAAGLLDGLQASDDKEGKDCVTIWKERCKLLARENRRLKALKEGRQVLQELAATDYQNQEQENQYQQVCTQLELTLMHMLEKIESLRRENAILSIENQGLQDMVDILASQGSKPKDPDDEGYPCDAACESQGGPQSVSSCDLERDWNSSALLFR